MRARPAQASPVTVLTPIVPGERDALESYLTGLSSAPGGSPLARVPGTHFARWVIVPDFVTDPKQPAPDPLGSPHLLFTSNVDGSADDYLAAVADTLTAEAPEIWGRCVGCPRPAAGAGLARYLRHNAIGTGLFFAAYPRATVQAVTAALDVHDRLVRLLVDTQLAGPAAIRAAFLKEFRP
ncbi:hypothetical protein CcI49_37765 [Frankia sp. CcI49]|uniref:hypothetical protein n=1 Tax=unclassified Frankia TaxID=2632575 RepID=UPI0006C9E9BB|nr:MULTISPECIES: hypothetical protein [unclassified Frankia]KPM56105.1 hypothetical protein ACG83_13225 [Frankia sp. R43]ONH50046.1 hypothetical protein CcI49_37765 [Frankia sp. CcI49]